MYNDDATSDGLPRFIYGEYTGETRLPDRPGPDEDGERPAPTNRQSIILLASGGLALVFIIGLVVAALSTGGANDTPAAANGESPAASQSAGATPSPTASPEPSPTWAVPSTDLLAPGPSATKTKTGKPTTTPPVTRPTTPKVPIPTFSIKPTRWSPHP
jgi:cytoskeletal protein RodZ